MKTLVVIAHPHMDKSKVNRRWMRELRKFPDEFTIDPLYEHYPDEKIDAKREQALVESHGNVILQFPIYWFNCPPLMKKWLDEVLLDGWAYGFNGDKLTDRKVGLSITTGSSEEDYSPDGILHHTLQQALLPFEMTFNYTNSTYIGFNAFYGVENEPTESRISESTRDYLDFLRRI